jgi:hypothetical protein
MIYYILKKNIIFFRIFYEKNYSNKIMTIFTQIISNVKKLLSFFKKNINDSTPRNGSGSQPNRSVWFRFLVRNQTEPKAQKPNH